VNPPSNFGWGRNPCTSGQVPSGWADPEATTRYDCYPDGSGDYTVTKSTTNTCPSGYTLQLFGSASPGQVSYCRCVNSSGDNVDPIEAGAGFMDDLNAGSGVVAEYPRDFSNVFEISSS
jgi:hypothetical protein